MTCKYEDCKWFGKCVAIDAPLKDGLPTCYEIAPPSVTPARVQTMQTNPRDVNEMIVSYNDKDGKTIRAIMNSTSQLRMYLFQLSERIKFVKIHFKSTGRTIDGNRRTLLQAAKDGSLLSQGSN